jgi:hypothetical protein
MWLSLNPTWSPAQVLNKLVATASTGKISNPGTGSPNRLLFVGTGGPPPQVTSFQCESGNSRFLCDLFYSSSVAATVTWLVNGNPVPAWHNRTTVLGACNSSTTVQAIVQNQYGASLSSKWSGCRSGPWL